MQQAVKKGSLVTNKGLAARSRLIERRGIKVGCRGGREIKVSDIF